MICPHTTICVFFLFSLLSIDITKLAFIQLCPQTTLCVLILLYVSFSFSVTFYRYY